MKKMAEIRLEKGMTQKDLANKVGCTQIDISRYELGTHKPSVQRLKDIADVLNVSMEDLL